MISVLQNQPAPRFASVADGPALVYAAAPDAAFPGFVFTHMLVRTNTGPRWSVEITLHGAPGRVLRRVELGPVAPELWALEQDRAHRGLAQLWDRWEAWLAEKASDWFDRLPPGADPGALDAAEAALGVPLPADLRASYARHDGDGSVRNMTLGIVGNHGWLSLAAALQTRAERNAQLRDGVYTGPAFDVRARGPVQAVWWHEAWLPITDDGSSNHLCVDLAPAEGGEVGQIIRVWNRSERREVVASSLTAWIEQTVERLEQGVYSLVPSLDGGVEFRDSGFA